MDALQQLNIAAPVADIFGKLEYDIIVAIARQLSKNPDKLINHTSEWRIQMLARMGKVSKETARYIAQQTKDVPGDVEAIINEVVTAVLDEHGLAGNDKVIDNLSKALEMFDHQAIEDKYNQVNTVMQYKARKAYVDGVNSVADRFEKGQIANKQEHLDILNKNALEVTLGEKTRTEAVRDTIREMADRGIPAFVDASGREWSPEAYVNMDIRNTAKNAALMSEFEATKELGQDVILVSSHAAARPLCAPYQGKFYSLSGKAGTITDAYGKEYTYTPLSSTSYGEPAGLFGINCGHTFRGVEDGMFVNNEETYSEKENSEEYEKVQKQRRMEREIRKNKMKRDALRAAGDEEGAREYDLKVRQGNKRLNEYCAENDLTVRNDRTQVYGYKDSSKKAKPKEFVETIKGPSSIDYMSKSFRPQFSQNTGSISVGELSIPVKRVTNSKFDIVTDIEATRRDKAVRLVERQLETISKQLPEGFKIPQIAVVDFEKHSLKTDAIGGYHAESGVLYFNSKYDTREKIIKFVTQHAGYFANTTEFAPILHELGHKNYENFIKTLAKSENMEYNKAKAIVNGRISDYIHIHNENGLFLEKNISRYADFSYTNGSYTEVCAECFSVRTDNIVAQQLLDAMRGELK